MNLFELGAIDIHIHPFTDEAIMSLGPSFTEAAEFFGQSPASPERVYVETGHGADIGTTYEHMREAGLGRAVMLNMVAHHNWGNALSNDFIASYCHEFPEMFLGLAGIDPHMEQRGAIREIERCLTELKLIGVKFHPAYQGFEPSDRSLTYHLYEALDGLGGMALFHTGTTLMSRTTINGCQPIHIDRIANDFPKLRIVMSHFGWPWTDEALAVAWRHEHVYLDLSGWLPRYIYGASPTTIHYMNTVLREKILFGSDYPPIHPKVWMEDFANLIEQGYTWGGRQRSFDQRAIELVMRDNAKRLLGLDSTTSD